MNLHHALLLALFLAGCTQPIPFDNSTQDNFTLIDGDLNFTNITSPTTSDFAKEKEEKKFEALGFGIFNYSLLTSDNCLPYYDDYRQHVLDLNEDIMLAAGEAEEEQEDVDQLEEQISEAEEAGDERALEKLQEKLRDEYDESEAALDVQKELEDTFHKYEIIRDQIKRRCIELQAAAAKS